jgi:hypothetical protein
MDTNEQANGRTEERTIIAQTGESCPRCSVAISVVYHPNLSRLEHIAQKIQEGYPCEVPDDWADGYEQPAYLHCDSPICGYHAVAEWSEIRCVLPVWMDRTAPTWAEVKEVIKS